MVCNPNDNSLNPPFLGSPPTVPGFGIPFSTPRIPLNIQIPDGIPEDILELIDSLLARLPGGTLKANPNNEMKDVWDAIADLLSQIAPFLTLYSFFQALLNMILCIIDVLCSLLNPWKTRRAVRRLFKRCLPDFISLFPWIALIAMILSLLLLLLALIEYIINLIISYIQDIIRNLQKLADAVQLDDSESVIAAAQKISYLLCLIEQIFAILGAFAAIFNIIRAMLSVQGRSVCGRGPSRQGDDNECCTEDVCPDFIANNENGLFGDRGEIKYLRQRYDFTINSLILRENSIQFYDETINQAYNFRDIITPVDGAVFWPESLTFDSLSSYRRTPYFVDMTFGVDPVDFGHTNDFDGYRTFQIKDVVVERRPYIGVYQYDGSLGGTPNGTLRLTGGLVYEADGITPYVNSGGVQHTIDSFITLDPLVGPIVSDDSVDIIDVVYNLKINHDALVGYQLINVMCVPDVALESLVFNTSTVGTFGIESAGDKLGSAGGGDFNTALPDVDGAVSCLQNALIEFRQNVSIENAAVFQSNMQACLDGLKEETESSFVGSVISGTDVYKSTVTLEPEVQFINTPISVLVQLRDANNVIISSNIPTNLQPLLEDKVKGNVTAGKISNFVYDGAQSGFKAEITSIEPVSGNLTIEFDGQLLNRFLNREDLEENTIIEPKSVSYRFVGGIVGADGSSVPGLDAPAKPRRDAGDVPDA